MPTNNRVVVAYLTLFCVAVAASLAAAAYPHCDNCGCKKKSKKMKRLVVVWEEVDIPKYACQPPMSFIPTKGWFA